MFTCTRCLSSTENDNDLCDACVKRIYETPEFGGGMIRADQIPDEVVEAAARAVADQLGDDWDDNVHTFCGDDWRLTPDGAKEACRAVARAAIAAALNAWPDVETRPTFNPSRIILPLAQEPRP